MTERRHETCDRCGALCITKDDYLLGPLEGKYEYLCKRCAREEEMTTFPLKWKKQSKDPI
jgi:hypothetical protein